jgi:hypothetical protein
MLMMGEYGIGSPAESGGDGTDDATGWDGKNGKRQPAIVNGIKMTNANTRTLREYLFSFMVTSYVEYTILFRICQHFAIFVNSLVIGGNGTRRAALLACTETS